MLVAHRTLYLHAHSAHLPYSAFPPSSSPFTHLHLIRRACLARVHPLWPLCLHPSAIFCADGEPLLVRTVYGRFGRRLFGISLLLLGSEATHRELGRWGVGAVSRDERGALACIRRALGFTTRNKLHGNRLAVCIYLERPFWTHWACSLGLLGLVGVVG
jgi:hypothetical protein